MPLSKQAEKWKVFSANVVEHIENYVVPQYGDEDSEPAKEYDVDDCIKQAQRYLARAKTNQRPEGLERDMRKAAHWIQKAWERIIALHTDDDVRIPEGVYYSEHTGQFYSKISGMRMGDDFYQTWCNHRSKFPNVKD